MDLSFPTLQAEINLLICAHGEIFQSHSLKSDDGLKVIMLGVSWLGPKAESSNKTFLLQLQTDAQKKSGNLHSEKSNTKQCMT